MKIGVLKGCIFPNFFN